MKETALIRASHNGHLHTVRRLLAAGAVIDAIDLVRGSGGNSCVEPAHCFPTCTLAPPPPCTCPCPVPPSPSPPPNLPPPPAPFRATTRRYTGPPCAAMSRS